MPARGACARTTYFRHCSTRQAAALGKTLASQCDPSKLEEAHTLQAHALAAMEEAQGEGHPLVQEVLETIKPASGTLP